MSCPDNKYPPKPCPCPEIPGPEGPQGPQGPMGPQGTPGTNGSNYNFEARIVEVTPIIDPVVLDAVAVGGTGPFTYDWSMTASTYRVNGSPAPHELSVVVGGSPERVTVSPITPNDGEGVIKCEITDTANGAIAIAYHYIKFSPLIP